MSNLLTVVYLVHQLRKGHEAQAQTIAALAAKNAQLFHEARENSFEIH